jgi:NAD(P)-dependent dehydrogenase (short-subunit alcohol dehydrogenase family)
MRAIIASSGFNAARTYFRLDGQASFSAHWERGYRPTSSLWLLARSKRLSPVAPPTTCWAIGNGMDLQLKGKLALVSGSTAGIGFAIAAALAAEGAQVIVNGRTEGAVADAIARLKSVTGSDVLGFAGDLSKAEIAEDLAKRYPEVEILVNNLGIFEPKPFEEIPDADWIRFFEVNVLSGVRLARLFLPAMRRANWGRIIFISSESGVQIPSEMVHYGMTKTAQLAVSRGLAETVAGTGITVNSVLPGPTKSRGVTDFVDQLAKTDGTTAEQFEKEFFEKIRPSSLIKRFATPGEVASLVAYVASPLASATTGAALRVDGGVIRSAL